jgi:enoyl-CoA hydratase/carnithine racemase
VSRGAYDGKVTLRDATSGPPRLELDSRIARIVLGRPEQHNAIEAEDVARFMDHLDRVDADASVRALVLTGTGPATFCAGASLPQLESGQMTPALFASLVERVAHVRPPTICALNGSAFGGGAELALCCDFRIGVHGSRLAVPAARLGLCYPIEGLRRFAGALGQGFATRLLVAAEEFDAEQMLEAGFLHRLVSPEELEGTADALAQELAALAPLAVQAMKRVLREIAYGELDEAATRRLVEACAASSDLREGLRARREGRAPSFRGA